MLETVRVAVRRRASTRPRPRRCSARRRRRRRARRTPFYPRSPYARGQAVRALDDDQLPRELRPARLAPASCSTTRARCAASSSSPARSPTAWPASSSGWRSELPLGNLDAKRDWGHARDYVRAMWLMLQQDKPDDYVIATGRTTTVARVLRASRSAMRRPGHGRITSSSISADLLRPAEVDSLRGDVAKARRVLGWAPQTTLEAAGRRDGRGRSRAGQARGGAMIAVEAPTRVIVTGAGGFVGPHLVAALRDIGGADIEVIATSLYAETHRLLGPLAALDVCDAAATSAAIARWRPTHVINLAGLASARKSPPIPRPPGRASARGAQPRPRDPRRSAFVLAVQVSSGWSMAPRAARASRLTSARCSPRSTNMPRPRRRPTWRCRR